MTTLSKITTRQITPEQLQEKKDLLEKEIERVETLVKPAWDRGHKTYSVCMEANLDRAKDALKSDEYKAIRDMIELMQIYPVQEFQHKKNYIREVVS